MIKHKKCEKCGTKNHHKNVHCNKCGEILPEIAKLSIGSLILTIALVAIFGSGIAFAGKSLFPTKTESSIINQPQTQDTENSNVKTTSEPAVQAPVSNPVPVVDKPVVKQNKPKIAEPAPEPVVQTPTPEPTPAVTNEPAPVVTNPTPPVVEPAKTCDEGMKYNAIDLENIAYNQYVQNENTRHNDFMTSVYKYCLLNSSCGSYEVSEGKLHDDNLAKLKADHEAKLVEINTRCY